MAPITKIFQITKLKIMVILFLVSFKLILSVLSRKLLIILNTLKTPRTLPTTSRYLERLIVTLILFVKRIDGDRVSKTQLHSFFGCLFSSSPLALNILKSNALINSLFPLRVLSNIQTQ